MKVKNDLNNHEGYLIVNPVKTEMKSDQINFQHLPRVSFCIPTFNNESTLRACLQSISTQNYPDIEIVIVDGGSKDRTVEIANEFTSNIFIDRGKLGSARQTSLENSTGYIVALFDSDIIIPHKDWLLNALRFFNYSKNVSTVWPLNLPPPNASLTSQLYFHQWKFEMEYRIAMGVGLFGGGNALFRREYLEGVGGINRNIHWGEDLDWARKLKEAGYCVIYIDDPLYHDTMRSLKQFAKKQFVGAETFTKTSFDVFGLSTKDIIYEQVILGLKGMIRGLFRERDPSWLLYPFFVGIRGTAYSYVHLKNILK